MLISDEYRAINTDLHRRKSSYGTSGARYKDAVLGLSRRYGTRDILDYGCGKQSLEKALGFLIANYDPAIGGLTERPGKHDLVVCTDVLEHVEPDLLEAVLDDLHDLMGKAGYLVACTRPAKKVLPDGRNAHLIIKPHTWWLWRIESRFNIIRWDHLAGGNVAFEVQP